MKRYIRFLKERDRVFWIIAVVLFLLVVGYTISVLSFVTMELNGAVLRPQTSSALIEHFDFDTVIRIISPES